MDELLSSNKNTRQLQALQTLLDHVSPIQLRQTVHTLLFRTLIDDIKEPLSQDQLRDVEVLLSFLDEVE